MYAGLPGRGSRPVALWALRLLGASWTIDLAYLAGAGLSLIVNLTGYAYVWSVQATLPELLPLHYNGAGVVDQIGAREELFKLPGIGSLLLAVNLAFGTALHGRERPAAHVLLWTALVVQVVLAAGAWVLVARANG